MRKIFVTIAALVMTFVMSVSAFGCNLIQVDNERDMAQVVAVVKVEDGAPEKENTIYKRDIMLAYLNYGYYYEQNYGYSREQTINLIVNNLITSRVYLQVAVIDFERVKARSLAIKILQFPTSGILLDILLTTNSLKLNIIPKRALTR
jgi:hypothetical protein